MKLSTPYKQKQDPKLSSYALTQAKQAANLLTALTSGSSFSRDPLAILRAA